MADTDATADAITTSRNLSGVLVLRIAQFPFLVLLAVLIPRMMGPEHYGRFALLISLITILESLAKLGVGDILGRFVPELDVTKGRHTVTYLFLRIFLIKTLVTTLLALGGIALLFTLYGPDYPAPYFWLIGGIVLIHDWAGNFFALLFGLNRMIAFSVREPLRRALSVGLILILYPVAGIFGALVAVLFVETSLLMYGFIICRHELQRPDASVELGDVHEYVRFGVFVYLSAIMLTFWERLGNPVIEHRLGVHEEIAYFDIGNQVFLVAFSITVMLLNSLIPIFSKFVTAGREEKLIEWAARVTKYMMIANLCGFAVIVLVGEPIITTVIGGDYARVFPNAVILVGAIFPMMIGQLGFVFSTVYKEPAKYLGALVSSVVVFVVLAWLLAPDYGSVGCSAAMGGAAVVLAGLAWRYYPKRIGVCAKRSGLALLLGVGVLCPAALAAAGDWLSGWVALGGFLVIYTGIVLRSKVLATAELKEILQAVTARA